jgi:hypothetical protein
MNRIESKFERTRGRRTSAARNRRLRPAVMGLEGRELLSTLTVSNTNDSGAGSLRAAVNQANSDAGGDTIVFSSLFSSPRTISLSGTLDLTNKATTTITGPGANLLTISGNKTSRVFDISGGSAVLSGLTITGGSADKGGGLLISHGTLTLTNCTVSGNAATVQGGGIATQSGCTTTLTDCAISGNTAPDGGGLADLLNSTLSLINATLSGNTASTQGGGLYNDGTATLTNCTISGNSANSGAGVATYSGNYSSATPKLTNTIVAGNTGGDIQGSLDPRSSNNLIGGYPLLASLGDFGGPTFTMALLPGSPAIGGGTSTGAPALDQRGQMRSGHVDIGAFQSQGTALLVNTTVGGVGSAPGQLSLPQAVNLANALDDDATIGFDSSVFASPQTITLSAGPLVLGAGVTTITGPGANLLSISGNNVSRVVDSSGTAFLSGLTITAGSADNGGGLRERGGEATLTNCTVSGNAATAQGGGLYDLDGALSLVGCTVSNNTARTGAGLAGIGGMLSLVNATVSGNKATGQAGGLYIKGGTATLTCATISANSAATGGGLANARNTATVTLTNTIVAGQTAGGDVTGNYTGSNNLIGPNVNPLLSPLGNYGGPTKTMALLPGSPAIGGGTATGAQPFDQRGQPRFGHVDIGAFQSQGFTLKPVANSTPQSAVVGKSFANPLAVTVTPNNPVEPVDGGVVNFAVTPVGGASATLSAATATITATNAGDVASVTATANATIGRYIVSATATGALPDGFVLTNTEAPSLKVTTRLDVVKVVDGLTSLREAIAYANSHPGPDTIIFDPASFGTKHRTIRLTGRPLVLTDPATTTIVGPGVKLLTISAGRKSRVFEIEGGSSALSGVTITGGNAGTGNGGALWNDGGTLWLDHVVLRGNRARIGGGLFNDGTTTLTDVVLRGNTARMGSGLFNTRGATLSRRALSRPASTGRILVDDFNGKGGIPTNWKQFAGQPGDVVEKLHKLTITDSTGNSAGIAATARTVPFNPVGVTTTNVARIHSVNSNGNAIFGLIGLNAQDSPAGYLAAGIDANGNVFIVSSIAPTLKLTPKLIGVVKGYSGKSITLRFTINSMGVAVDGGGFKSGLIPFKDLSNFSLAAAFPKGDARPALGVASHPGQMGGSASFESISLSTA